jgi:zinc transport system substrate-binding protein
MRRRIRTIVGLAVAFFAVATASTGCDTSGGAAKGRLQIVTAFYPLQFIAEKVGGDRVTVSNLAQPGAEPHDLELSPRQVANIADADLVVYLAGFQPAVDEAVAQEAKTSFDAASVVPLIEATGQHDHDADSQAPAPSPTGASDAHAGKDPHLWLDPTRLAIVARELGTRFVALDPDGATGYGQRVAGLRAQLESLDREFADGLKDCQRREIVVSHAAFGYLADRYDLEQISISGLSPEAEPTPQRLAEVTAEAQRHGATTIFFETLVSPEVAEAIATEVGATTAVLDPLEGLSAGSTEDYLSVMRANLRTLKPALGCV